MKYNGYNFFYIKLLRIVNADGNVYPQNNV